MIRRPVLLSMLIAAVIGVLFALYHGVIYSPPPLASVPMAPVQCDCGAK